MEFKPFYGATALSHEAASVMKQTRLILIILIRGFSVTSRIDKNPQRSSGFHISDILQLNSQAPAEVKPRSPMDYSVYNYNEYQSRQHYYSTYHPQILPSTLSTFESDLPFYSTTFGSAPSTYNGNLYFTSESAASYGPSQMLPATLPNRFLMNDANNNSFGKTEEC